MTRERGPGVSKIARSPEEHFLLAAVRTWFTPEARDVEAALLAPPLDWEHATRLASRHQVLPLLCRALATVEAAALPSSVRVLLQREADTRRARNRQLATELVRLLRLASAADVRLLPFKGPVLAAAIYGDLGLRQFADLDLLIDAAERTRVAEFLRSLGYRCRVDHGWETEFIQPDGRAAIDLHSGLTPDEFPVPLAFSRLWARRERVLLDGEPVETLCVDDLLVVLCIQVARDAWQGKTRLAKICDLGQVLRLGERVRWERVDEEARALGVRRVVEFGIGVAAQVLDLPLTVVPRPTGRHRAVQALVRQEVEALFDDPKAAVPSRVRGDLLHFHLRERWRHRLAPYRLHGARVLAPNERDRAMVALPGALSWLHYVLRPVRLLRQYGRYLTGGRLG